MLLRPGDVLASMQECGEFGAVVLVVNERVGLEYSLQALASFASLVAELGELLEVAADLTFVPGDQDRFDVWEVLVQRRTSDGSFAADVLPASLIAATGMALAFIPSLGTAISSARPEEGGLASGIMNTSYQVGSALGLAAMTALATSQGAGQLGDPHALTDGFSAAFLGAAAIAVAGALLALATLRQPPQAAPPAPVERAARERAAEPAISAR